MEIKIEKEILVDGVKDYELIEKKDKQEDVDKEDYKDVEEPVYIHKCYHDGKTVMACTRELLK